MGQKPTSCKRTDQDTGERAHKRSHLHALYVDLDGTLVQTDTLWESVIRLLARRPWLLLIMPVWLAGGPARFKDEVARRVTLSPGTLPYNTAVLDFLRMQRAQGRSVVLATGAHRRIAEDVASHLGVFDTVLASDVRRNLKAHHKLAAIREHSEDGRFDYLGDHHSDVPIWEAAGGALVVGDSPSLHRRLNGRCKVVCSFSTPSSLWGGLFRVMRLHQWVKNLLLLVPLALAHKVDEPRAWAAGLLAVLGFCLCASSVYVLNDLLDLETDRRHPDKRRRPIAAGALSIPSALLAAAVLAAVGVGLCVLLLPAFYTALLVLYMALATAYSFWLKRVIVLDVLMLAGLYTYRVLVGGVAVEVPISNWLLAFSMFFFLSLAFIKRYADIHRVERDGATSEGEPPTSVPYKGTDVELLRVLGPSAGYLSVLVLALYIQSDAVTPLYTRPDMLWLVCPCLLYWITRVWVIAHRGEMTSDPIVFAITDTVSYGVGAAVLAIGVAAA